MKTIFVFHLCASLALVTTAFGQPQHIPTPEEVPPGYVQIDGDVIMRIEDVNTDSPTPHSIYAPGTVWPNNRIPIEYNANVTAANQALFVQVLAQWTAVCNVTFPPRAGEPAYLHVMGDSSICGFDFATSAGYTGSRVEIHVSTQGPPNCMPASGFPPDGWNLFQLVHEVGHIMGFQHEQGRDDRETGGYVHIETGNISSGNAPQFAIYNPQRHYGPYDFDSVMHYGSCSFSACGNGSCLWPDATCRTISVLPPYFVTWQPNIGQRDHLSLMDRKLAAYMYRPGNMRFLDPGQSGSTQQGTLQEPYITLSAALQNTPAGGTIQIAPGVALSPMTLNQNVTLRAALWDAQMDPATGNLIQAPSGYSTLVRQ